MSDIKTIKIDQTEYMRVSDAQALAKRQMKLKPLTKANAYTVGDFVHIETVTKYFVGELVAISDEQMVLNNAAWVAHTGRPHEYFKGTKAPTSLEPLGDGWIIERGSVVGGKAIPKIEIVVR